MKKNKILVLVDWFAPGFKGGGPIQSCLNFALRLKDDFDIYILTTDTDFKSSEPYEQIIPNQWSTHAGTGAQVYYARKTTLSLKQIREQVIGAAADYVYLNQFFTPRFVMYPVWLKYTGRLKSKVVLSPRGALFDSSLSVKTTKKKIFLRAFRLLGMHKVITFQATNEVERDSILKNLPGSRVKIADNLPVTHQQPFSSCEKKPGELKCIFIARIAPLKNLLYLIRCLKLAKGDISLTVVGPKEDEAYFEKCEEAMAELPATVKVNYLGPKKNAEVGLLISAHHLYVFPTRGENFGHSIFDSLMAGRPVLISDQTPWRGLAEKQAGWDLPLDHPERFTEVLNTVTAFDQGAFDEWARGAWQHAHRFIENPDLHRQYLQLFP